MKTKKKKIVKKKAVLLSADEFAVGKHGIGWISSIFQNHFKDNKFEARALPAFQKLPRDMNDAAIESELKPRLCELGDILAFLDHAPEECKDGKWNLFYTPAFVVRVYWDAGRGAWFVDAWRRGGNEWLAGFRVFSPATGSVALGAGPLVSLALAEAIKLVKKEGYRIFKEV